MSRVASLLLVVSVALVAPPARAERARLDGVAAVVGASAPREGTLLVLHSDVELEAWLERARHGAVEGTEPAPSGAELDEARERLVSLALLVFEASRLRLDRVDEDHRSAEWRRFFERHGGAEAIETIGARLHLADDELERRVGWDAIARSFVLASSEQGGIVTELELEQAWESGEHPFVGMDLETMRETMRAWLLEQRLARETTLWIERLRGRVVVRRSRRA